MASAAPNGSPTTSGTTNGAAVLPVADAKSPESKVTAETYGRLDTHQVSNQVWMIRIPPKLAKVWQDAPEGTVLGDLVFTKGGTTQIAGRNPKANAIAKKVPPSFEVHVLEELANTAPAATTAKPSSSNNNDLPLTYSLQAMTKRVPLLHPFTRHSDGSVELHGTVSRSANLQMKANDSRYKQLCKNRLLTQNVNSSRYVRPVDATELSVRKTHVSAALQTTQQKGQPVGFGNAVQLFGKRLMEANEAAAHTGQDSTSRKRKYEGQTTQSVVFALFSEKPFWTVKEMRSVSGRPEKELRAVLAEIGGFHRSGEHKGAWALRSEFRKQS